MLLHDTLTREAQRRPDAVAVVSNGELVKYGRLDEWTNQLARLLIAGGCRTGDRVGILLPKSVPAIVGLLGTLKAGGIYVPLDTRSPAARLAKIVEVCEPACILAGSEGAEILNRMVSDHRVGGSVRVGWFDPGAAGELRAPVAFSWDDLSQVPGSPVNVHLAADSPAHILFTSGSTGVPKGVIITHSNVVHFLNWAKQYFGMVESDRVSCHPPLHFDLSTFDIYGTLLAGAELHLVPADVSLLPHKLAAFIRTSELTQWFSVPSALRFMAQFDVIGHHDFPSLKRLLWCGEALPTPTLIHWMKRLPHVQFTNLYGPTEATIASSYYTVPHCPDNDTEPIPIGRACAGEELIVLNESLEPAATGEVGDLYIRGVGLSPGYWNDEQKTRSVFFNDTQGIRMYKTGDLAKTDEDGLVYLLGRSDSQIKSRGYRIELGEIEAALYALGPVRECAVVAVPSGGFDGMAVCCAYALAPGNDLAPADLRQRLSELLPSYMLPSCWMPLEALPLNANGKVDRPRVRQQFAANAAAA